MSEMTFQKIACFGGIYNNYLALEAAIQDAKRRGAEKMFCLGDLGAFGPYPDRVFPLIRDNNIDCIQGNYDDSIGNELDDCQCGYLDPRDNHFAQISYDYTLQNTNLDNRQFLKSLPKSIDIQLGRHKVHLCHGSPRKTNEFLWKSTTSDHFLEYLISQQDCDLIVGTHSGIKWQQTVANGMFVNVGVLGRPENDGTTNVWYAILENKQGKIEVEFVPLDYDFERLAGEMKAEKLPDEFVETVCTGWWTTCLEILPSKERLVGKY